MRVQRPVRSLVHLLVHKAPIEAQLIVTRRCNLSCGYCTEYDHSSEMIPLDVLQRRIDALHRLHTVNLTLLGGEPLMHPDIDAIVSYGARHAQVSITTNGFLVTPELIDRLNEAGLSNMQLSLDLMGADRSRYIQKSYKTLRPKLLLLQRHAHFDVHVNVVLCEQTKEDFPRMVSELTGMGFRVAAAPMHDGDGTVQVGGADYVALWDALHANGAAFAYSDYEYGRQLLEGERPGWHCRAGSRMLYVDEFGKVQLCSAQRDRLNAPVESYTTHDLRKQSRTKKGCEEGCSLMCVYRDSQIDNEPLVALKGLVKLARSGGMSRGARTPSPTVAPA